MLNEKGFTLIEVLMVISILGVILAIAIPSGYNYYETSKNKTEQIFIGKLNRIVDDYITLKASSFTLDKTNSWDVKKCSIADEGEESYANCKLVKAYKVTDEVKFANIINEQLISESDFISPKTNIKCNKDSLIEIYQDEDLVNYFRYNLDCVSDDNRNDGYVYNSVTFLTNGE